MSLRIPWDRLMHHYLCMHVGAFLIQPAFWCYLFFDVFEDESRVYLLSFHSLGSLKCQLGRDYRSLPRLKWHLEWGLSVSSFPQGFQQVLKNASKSPPGPVSEVAWGATEDGRCEHSQCLLSGADSPSHPPETFEIKSSGFLSFCKVEF